MIELLSHSGLKSHRTYHLIPSPPCTLFLFAPCYEVTPTPAGGVGGGVGGGSGTGTGAPTAAPTNADGTRGFLIGDNNGDGVVDSMDDINGAWVEQSLP